MTSSQDYTAQTLLDAYLDLHGLAPASQRWSEREFADNPPRALRYRRLIALLTAFGLPTSITMFEAGAFIGEDDSRYLDLIPELFNVDDESVATVTAISGDRAHERRFHLKPRDFSRLSYYFEGMLAYRVAVDRPLRFTSGYLAAPKLLHIGVAQMSEVNDGIRQDLRIIDGPLCRLISPESRSFSRQEMVDRYGYPVDDLQQIDGEWY
ncbi:hypothetical protein [Gordonia phthalatica]|uniref:Uncharacterized protein n=1 Tax=Gordonia phthalatica TaxID=1136941 RepID=A0A0N9NIN7_9ACTN|nr:hypothetical protein [Gordonia phthalatica]ALG85405.1 hypothetical protein ACH46_14120 [Gordonia phthalatica]